MKKKLLLFVGLQLLLTALLYAIPTLRQYLFLPLTALLASIFSACLGIEEIFTWRKMAEQNQAQMTEEQRAFSLVFSRFGKVACWSQLLVIPMLLFLLWNKEKASWETVQNLNQVFQKNDVTHSHWESLKTLLETAKQSLYFSLWMFTSGIICGTGLGILVGLLWKRRSLAYLSLGFIIIISVLMSAWKLVIYPSWMTENPFFGYLMVKRPSLERSLYHDSWFSFPFVLHRMEQILWLIGLILLGISGLDLTTKRWKPWFLWYRKKQALGIAVFMVLLGWTFDQANIWFPEKEALQQELYAKKITKHFILHYKPNGFWEKHLVWVAFEHEFRYNQLKQKLGKEPDWKTPNILRWLGIKNQDSQRSPKILVYLFDDELQANEFLNTRGDVPTFARPWNREIFLTSKSPWPLFAISTTLLHEQAHIFAGSFGDSIFHLSQVGLFPNLGMIEGTAQALAGDSIYSIEYLQAVARLKPNDSLDYIDLDQSFRSYAGIGKRSQGEIYTITGSFCGYLAQKSGWDLLMKVYQQGGRPKDFAQVYQKSFSQLKSEWLAFVKAQAPIPTKTLFRNYFLEYHPYSSVGFAWSTILFGQDICALWKLEEIAHKELGTKICEKMKKHRYPNQVNEIDGLLDAQNLIHAYPDVALWHLWAGWLLFQNAQYERAAQELDQALRGPLKYQLLFELRNWALFLQGHALFQIHEFAKAQKVFESILQSTLLDEINPSEIRMIQDWIERTKFAAIYF